MATTVNLNPQVLALLGLLQGTAGAAGAPPGPISRCPFPAGGAAPPWRTVVGFAAGPTGSNKAEGWMPVELPQGTNVDVLTVRGKRPGAVTIWSAALRRVELAGTAQADICA